MSTVPVPMTFPSASVIVIVASGSHVPVIGVVLGLKLDGIRTVGATGAVVSTFVFPSNATLALLVLPALSVLVIANGPFVSASTVVMML